jgi:hypothetical protein
MIGLGKSLLAGLIAGSMGALFGYGVARLFIGGDDPERYALSVMLILTFLAGTVTCGVAAARFNPPKPFNTAIVAALCFETILLIVARPGLGFRALAIAFGVAVFFALIGAFIGLPRNGT